MRIGSLAPHQSQQLGGSGQAVAHDGVRRGARVVANLGHDSSKEHLGEGGGQIHLEQLLEGENPLAPLSAAGACKFNPACCRARKRFDGEAEARLGILARICLHLEPTAADPTPFPLDAAHFVQPSDLLIKLQ